MSDSLLRSGQTPKTLTSEKPFTYGSKPSEKSSEKSTSQHSQRQATTENLTRVKSPSDKREEIAALLRGETKPNEPAERDGSIFPSSTDAGASAGEPNEVASTQEKGIADGLLSEPSDPGAGNKLPDTFDPKFLAEQLGIKPQELYERLQITTQEGELINFGEWKDRVTDQQSTARANVEREQELDRREAGMRETLQLLQSVGADISANFPNAQQALADYSRQVKAVERQRAVTAMPELADETYRAQFTKDVEDHLGQFGFRASELNIMDHRILLALKDAIKTKRQLDKLMSFEPNETPPKSQRPQGKRKRITNTDKLIAQARDGTTADKVAAAGAILRGGR